jgi:hypothetical protein
MLWRESSSSPRVSRSSWSWLVLNQSRSSRVRTTRAGEESPPGGAVRTGADVGVRSRRRL